MHHISRKAQHKLALGQHFQAIDPHSSHLLPVPIVSDAWAKGEGVLHLLGVWPECKWSPGHQRLQDGGNHRHQHHLSSFAVLVAHCEEQRGSLRVATFSVLLGNKFPHMLNQKKLNLAWYSWDGCSDVYNAEIFLSAWTASLLRFGAFIQPSDFWQSSVPCGCQSDVSLSS